MNKTCSRIKVTAPPSRASLPSSEKVNVQVFFLLLIILSNFLFSDDHQYTVVTKIIRTLWKMG